MSTPRNRSVLKAFTLLRSFQQPDEWLTSSELSRRANLPQASGYRLVQTLEEIGAIVRDSRGRYAPGMLLLELSQNIVRQDLWRVAPHNVLKRWASELDVTVQLGVLEDGMVTYVARVGKQSTDLLPGAGMQFEAYCTGLGKVLLAALQPDALRAFFAIGDLVALTRQTIVDRDQLMTELGRIQRHGFAVDDCEAFDHIRCIAAPIRNSAGATVAAISFSDSAERLDEARQALLRDDLFAAAREVADRLHPWHSSRAPDPIAAWRRQASPAIAQASCR